MNYAKLFILLSVAFLLPALSSLALDNDAHKNTGYFYISGQYKPSIPQFNKFSIREDDTKTEIKTPKSLSKDVRDITVEKLKGETHFTLPYNPTYKKNLLGAGGTIGYAKNNFRVELETFYEKFNLNTPSGYIYDSIYEYFNIEVETKLYVMRNSGITLSPVLINLCYDITKKIARNISPSLCFGIGVDLIDFLDKVTFKPSYQAKVGVNYLMSQNLALFIEGSFHGHLGNQFTNLALDYPNDHTFFTSVSAKLNLNFLGTSIGIRFIF